MPLVHAPHLVQGYPNPEVCHQGWCNNPPFSTIALVSKFYWAENLRRLSSFAHQTFLKSNLHIKDGGGFSLMVGHHRPWKDMIHPLVKCHMIIARHCRPFFGIPQTFSVNEPWPLSGRQKKKHLPWMTTTVTCLHQKKLFFQERLFFGDPDAGSGRITIPFPSSSTTLRGFRWGPMFSVSSFHTCACRPSLMSSLQPRPANEIEIPKAGAFWSFKCYISNRFQNYHEHSVNIFSQQIKPHFGFFPHKCRPFSILHPTFLLQTPLWPKYTRKNCVLFFFQSAERLGCFLKLPVDGMAGVLVNRNQREHDQIGGLVVKHSIFPERNHDIVITKTQEISCWLIRNCHKCFGDLSMYTGIIISRFIFKLPFIRFSTFSTSLFYSRKHHPSRFPPFWMTHLPHNHDFDLPHGFAHGALWSQPDRNEFRKRCRLWKSRKTSQKGKEDPKNMMF